MFILDAVKVLYGQGELAKKADYFRFAKENERIVMDGTVRP